MPIQILQTPAGGNSASAGAAFTINLTSTAAGEAIFVAVFSGTTTAPTVTDSAGNTYVEDATHNASTNWRVGIWSKLTPATPVTSVTVTPPASNFGCAFVLTASGILAASAFDKTAAAETISNTNYSSGNTVALSQPNELALGLSAGGAKGGAGSYGIVAGGSWINPVAEIDIPTDNDAGRIQYQIVNTNAVLACTGTNNAGGFVSPGQSAIIATYKALGVPGWPITTAGPSYAI